MATGTIKRIIADRGFGFIAGVDGKEYFFHRDGLTASLQFEQLAQGESVEFELQESPRGPRAVNVRAPSA
jgi:CspA family cold shock protein